MGGVKNIENMTLPFFGSKILNLLVFFNFEPKKFFDAVYALSSHFCYVGGFGDLGDPVLPTLRGVIWKDVFCSL